MPGQPIDFDAEGLLDGLEGEARAERLALLEYLTQQGMPLAQMRRATATDTLMFLPAERVIGGERRYTFAEISQLSGITEEHVLALSRAMGVAIPAPDEATYTDSDLEIVRMTHVTRAIGITDEENLAMLRALGRGLSQAAEAMRAVPLRVVLEPGLSEHDLAERYASTVSELAPLITPLITGLLSLHLRQMAQGEAINAAERSGGRLPGSREIAVCFADLVGFTRLGEEVAPEELGGLAVRLETLTSDVIEQPVKLVKTIGDAVMLASSDPEPLLASALALLAAAEQEGEEFPQLRVGVARGAALGRAGDWFGRPVNLASRITAVARPGTLLAERSVRDSAPEAYRWSYAGQRRLKGIREPVSLYRARELEAAG
ncbi:MAG: adenylate cyclase regulatory domain-containing protein [Solirubrobacteraceae bacterium]